MRSTGSRKGQTSITHLMNFSLPPRPQNHFHGHGRSYRRNPAWGPGSGYHAVDKARLVEAWLRLIGALSNVPQICPRELPLHCRPSW